MPMFLTNPPAKEKKRKGEKENSKNRKNVHSTHKQKNIIYVGGKFTDNNLCFLNMIP